MLVCNIVAELSIFAGKEDKTLFCPSFFFNYVMLVRSVHMLVCNEKEGKTMNERQTKLFFVPVCS